MFTQTITYPAAFLAGLLSFFSPCILPLIPAYFSFITGFSLEQLTGEAPGAVRKQVMVSTLAYVLGFSFVFVCLGASASLLGGIVRQYQTVIRITGGLLIVFLGLHLTGIIRIRALEFEKRVHLSQKPLHLLGTFVVGMAFGAGWSPCIGPLLGSILIVAGSQETIWQGIALLGLYSAGLAIPFLIISVFINSILTMIRKASRVLRYVNVTAGLLLVAVGVLIVTNNLYLFSG